MTRATSPVVAVPMLVGVTVLLAAVLATTTLGFGATPDPGGPVVLAVTATADGGVSLVNEGGETIDVSEIAVRISVDGEALDHQPPVPYLGGATGFRGLPTGPFNGAADPLWEPGEDAGVTVAGSNDPEVTGGSTVVVRLLRDGVPIARAEAQVEG